MTSIAPTITAFDPHEYREQMEAIQDFAQRVHIDLMDGLFAPTKSPSVEECWWPDQLIADIHLMYQKPMDEIEKLIEYKPNLVVIHYEAEVDHLQFASKLNEAGIRSGIALLSETPVRDLEDILPSYDHVLVFSGKLGFHGGAADMRLLSKVSELREKYPHLEVSWDGGITDLNVRELVDTGVEVLNVGGFIQKSGDPAKAYNTLIQALT
jgi:ribulose-phosphate 3-epimerase